MAVQQVKTVVGGLVLRVTDTKESDKILTVLTAELGRISVIARGARQKNSRLAAASQLFAWSEMTLYKRGEWYYLSAADPMELFAGLQTDLVRLSLAAYLSELTEFVAGEDTPAPELLRLLLNGLYALAALRHILQGSDKKLYAFSLPEDDLKLLDRAAEAFAAAQLERNFRTLGYYKAVLI